ncbi:hypothetical protein QUA71_09430 [Microcoleus sp. MON1_C5]|uniref:hypothetical protein n=1 Tax=Microcoleus sp. MON1_C5 TaxID=2818828 RepID=UPI002FD5A76F
MIEVYSLSIITPVAGVSVAWLGHGLSIERLINSINSIAQHFVFPLCARRSIRFRAFVKPYRSIDRTSIEQCFLSKN